MDVDVEILQELRKPVPCKTSHISITFFVCITYIRSEHFVVQFSKVIASCMTTVLSKADGGTCVKHIDTQENFRVFGVDFYTRSTCRWLRVELPELMQNQNGFVVPEQLRRTVRDKDDTTLRSSSHSQLTDVGQIWIFARDQRPLHSWGSFGNTFVSACCNSTLFACTCSSESAAYLDCKQWKLSVLKRVSFSFCFLALSSSEEIVACSRA